LAVSIRQGVHGLSKTNTLQRVREGFTILKPEFFNDNWWTQFQENI